MKTIAPKRIKKYEKKVDSNIIGARYDATKTLAVEQEKSYFQKAEELEIKVKAIVSNQPTISHHFYIAFAEEIAKKKQDNERWIIFEKWQRRGLNVSKLAEIALKLFGFSVVKLKMYEYCNTDDIAADIIYGANLWAAQQFTIGVIGPNENMDINSIKLKLNKITFPEHTVNECDVSIQTVDGNGKPTGVILSSGTFDGDSLPEFPNSAWKEITMSPYTLQKSTMYVIVVKALNIVLTAKLGWKYAWPDTYFGGIMYTTSNGGASWDGWDDYDYMFEVWGVGPQ